MPLLREMGFLLQFTTVIVSVVCVHSFLLGDDECVSYGECGPGFNSRTVLNCPATDSNRMGLILNSTKGLDILKRLCPDLYKGDTNTRTCCSESQLITFQTTIGLAQQMLGKCPSCTRNFQNLFCQVACGLNQAKFIWPNMTHEYPAGYNYTPAGIPSTSIVLSRQYAEDFYNSCKDIQFLGLKVISLFCGAPAENCTATKLLSYMGSIYNGVAPFPIQYIFQEGSWTSPDNKVLTPLHLNIVPCNRPVPGTTDKACSCENCAASCGPARVPCPSGHFEMTEKMKSDASVPHFTPNVRRSQLVISRPNNDTQVRHENPPPVPGYVNFSSMFAQDFLQQVLDLQDDIGKHAVAYNGNTFTLDDICYKPSSPVYGGCAVESVLQYWQNNRTNLDKIMWDDYQLFHLADYFDHFLSCTKNPFAVNDNTKLNMTCRADYGATMKPMNILGGYDGINYHSATSFVISYYLDATSDDQKAKADAWEIEMDKYLQNYPTNEMAICFWP